MVEEDEILRPMLTVREVSEMLHVHVNTVRRWSDRNILKSYRINKRGDRRFSMQEITKMIAEMNNYNVGDTL